MTNSMLGYGKALMALSENIKKCRKDKGLSQAEAAEKSGIPKSTWIKYENGDIEPTAEPIRAIAKGLGVSTDEILLSQEERSIKQELRTLFEEIEKLSEEEQTQIKRTIKGLLLVLHQERLNQA